MNFKKIIQKIKDNPVADRIAGSLFALILIAVASGIVFYLAKPKEEPKVVSETEIVETIKRPLEDVSIEARSAIVFDLETGETLYQKDADRILPLASITKIMTALTARESIPDYTVISIDPSFLEEEGDTGLLSKERFRLKDLLDLSLVSSSNDGSRAIASVIGAFESDTSNYDYGRLSFVESMNQKAGELGLSRTKFWNETGLDLDETQSGGYGSARDVANLFAYILKNHPDLLEATQKENINVTSLTSQNHSIDNTNTIIGEIPGIIASKTGFTDLAGGNLVIAFNDGLRHPIVVVVLGSSFDGRFTDVLTLSEATRAQIAQKTIEDLLVQNDDRHN